VMPDDTPESLHARIQVQEHILYPAMIRRVLSEQGR
jgi:phosphoribosylglycinamide formyltransferase-1